MKRLLLALCITATPLISAAAISDALTYQGNPVHPACFDVNLDQATRKTINLKACSADKSKVTLKDGYYTNQDEKIRQETFTRYAVIGHQDDRYLVVSGSWTGGSGFFTEVTWYKKSGDSLITLKTLASGDRCNGGVASEGAWQYSVNLTPVDMLSLANGGLPKINAYQDLDASAAGCVAKAIYQFNPEKQVAVFKSIQLNKKPLSIDKWVLELKYQYCFNRLYNTFVESNRTTFAQVDLDHFKNQFETICMESGR